MLRCVALGAALLVGTAADPPLAGDVKPLSEDQRKEAVGEWRKRYDVEVAKLKGQLKEATADLAFPVTREAAKAKVAKTKELLARAEKDRFAVMPPLAVRAVGTDGQKTEVRPGLTMIDTGTAAAKPGAVGVLPYAYGTEVRWGDFVRWDETGTLVVLRVDGRATTSVTSRPGKQPIVQGGKPTTESVRVVLIPPVKAPTKQDPSVPLGGLWRTAGIIQVDGAPVAAFQRVEVKPEDLPKK